jgi:drug/metabolite transporter (DMT)-like permease
MIFQEKSGHSTNPTFGWLIVIATFLYGLNANIVKRYLSDTSPVTITSIAFAMMIIPAAIILTLSDFASAFTGHSPVFASLGYIAILAVLGSALASILFNKLILRTSALFAASTTYLIAIVALFWGIVAGEPIGWLDLAGMGLILFGVYLVGR